jgi:hypothetical protein
MQEVPTFAAGLLAALLLFKWRERRARIWLLLSGTIMGLALQLKLTAALIFPAIMGEIFLAHWCWAAGQNVEARRPKTNEWGRCLRFALRDAIIWSLPLIITFIVITFIWGQGSFQSSWKAHATGHAVAGFGSPEDGKFTLSLLTAHSECVVAARFGIFLVLTRKLHRDYLFPVILLMTAAGIHSVHRPWWNYYYLHWSIPFSWLAGLAVSTLIGYGLRVLSHGNLRMLSGDALRIIAVCGLAAVALARPGWNKARIGCAATNALLRIASFWL